MLRFRLRPVVYTLEFSCVGKKAARQALPFLNSTDAPWRVVKIQDCQDHAFTSDIP
jgi:hypothetical protein